MQRKLVAMHVISFEKILKKIFVYIRKYFSLFSVQKKAAFCKDHAISVEHYPLNYSSEQQIIRKTTEESNLLKKHKKLRALHRICLK